MFEFKMSYKEPGYHTKENDLPFIFPPKNENALIESNLVEIEGRNGSGKTTLLNCLAIALGYLYQEKDLGSKPALKAKLEDLDENKTLEYEFRIGCEKPENIDLRVKRVKGQTAKFWLNSQQVTADDIIRKFDIVFLTEDDPLKVVTSSLGKVRKHFIELEKGLGTLQDGLFKNLQDIVEYHDFERKESKIINEIQDAEKKVDEAQIEYDKAKELLKEIELKESIFAKLQLHKKQKEITDEYETLKKKCDELKGKTGTEIIRKLEKERWNLRTAKDDLTTINSRITQICTSLGTYGVKIQSEMLLNDDHSELNELNKKMGSKQQQAEVKLQMVEEMIILFKHYHETDIVPLINVPVQEAVRNLYSIKAKAASERVFTLLGTLNTVVTERKDKLIGIEKITEKISALTKQCKELEGIGNLQNEFSDAQSQYLDLQMALKCSRSELLDQWTELKETDGNVNDIKSQLDELHASIHANETIKNKCTESLTMLRENSTKKPKHEKDEEKIRKRYEDISRLRENVFQWAQILQDPSATKEQFLSIGDRPGFGLVDYQKFVKAIGEYLGNQFEPVAYDYKFHNIKFFDVEKNTFTTSEDRQIPIDKLSQGQSKITTLTGSFKKMDPGKKKIVLIDEIADLDPENLQNVKNTLKEKLIDGSLVLAVLVRPLHETSAKIVEIKGWT